MDVFCKDCKNKEDIISTAFGKCAVCSLTRTLPWINSPVSCKFYNVDTTNLRICNNCEHYLGGGDFGLSCKEDYYKLCDGMDKACDKFKNREGVK